MAEEFTDAQLQLINSIAKTEGFEDFHLETTSGSSKGDGYLSVVTQVTIKENSGGKTHSLIVKSAQTDDRYRETAPVLETFRREIDVYSKLFPEFTKFMQEHNIETPLYSVPKCFGTCDLDKQECIVFENLRELNYKLFGRTNVLNAAHTEMVFKEYGIFHGVSFAFKEKRPEKYKEQSQFLTQMFQARRNSEKMKSMNKRTFDRALKAVKDNEEAFKALTWYFKDEAGEFMKKTREECEFSTVIHGDCWINNMMFKYAKEDPETPTEICLLDWQMCRITSPIFDLSHFFYVCCPKNLLDDYQRYLKIYHDNLSETLRKFQCDPGKIFSFDALQDQWRRYSKYGFHLAIMFVTLMVIDVEDVPDIAEVIKSGKEFTDAFDGTESKCEEAYESRIRDLVVFLVENKLL